MRGLIGCVRKAGHVRNPPSLLLLLCVKMRETVTEKVRARAELRDSNRAPRSCIPLTDIQLATLVCSTEAAITLNRYRSPYLGPASCG
jgi:hypothetical protein